MYNIDVNLQFTANTEQAKVNLQNLQNQLNNLMLQATKGTPNGLGINKDLSQTISQVSELQALLETSKTSAGTLDLSKFNQGLKSSKINISDYAKTLQSLGPQGEQAFMQLARSITSAEIPLKRTSSLLQSFALTLKNAAKWQISSSILHGLLGATQSAYGYAQDLNESLNNIRIVTGKNTDQMAQFAKEANKAAKALNTTTTKYTDASLIYYQQGLSSQEVKERTDVTIKMANVARESAETVSDQMTSVWNNFYDGSKSLEYYADVMTALGAATASSTDEIAQGLEKFSAIADTVGLSYEYATSALATVTAETRQSAEVVGTAFKTMFARIQGLKLGETLEDGTTFNQYSEALMAVGINIKDANGELKNMDTILNEMGTKWQILNRDEQVALAQKVAGVRQYSQLVALMDNWDKFQINLDIAEESEGTLQKQTDIYAESWEAARDRVRASLEDIYNKLLNDKAFIKMTDTIADFVDIISDAIDGLGGLPGVLSLISTLMFKIFGDSMAKSIQRISYNIKMQKKGYEELIKLRQDSSQAVKDMYLGNKDSSKENKDSSKRNNIKPSDVRGNMFVQEIDTKDVLIAKTQELTNQGTKLTEQEEQRVKILLDILQIKDEEAIKSKDDLEKQQKKNQELQDELEIRKRFRTYDKENVDNETYNTKMAEFKEASVKAGFASNVLKQYNNFENITDFEKVKKEIQEMTKQSDLLDGKLESVFNASKLEDFRTELDTIANSNLTNISQEMERLLQSMGFTAEDLEQLFRLEKGFVDEGEGIGKVGQKVREAGNSAEAAKKDFQKLKGSVMGVSEASMVMMQNLSSISMLISSIKGLIDTWKDEDAELGDKVISTVSSLGMNLSMIFMMFNEQSTKSIKTMATFLSQGSKAVAAGEAANITMGKSIAILGKYAIIIGAVVAAIALLVKWYNKDSNASKEAEKQAKNLSEAYENLKNSQQELISTINSYDEAIKKTKELTTGTDEFKDAVNSANDAALELLKTYKDLDYKINENGLIEIDPESLEKAKKKKETEVTNARLAAAYGEREASVTRVKEKETELSRYKIETNSSRENDDAMRQSAYSSGSQYSGMVELGIFLKGIVEGSQEDNTEKDAMREIYKQYQERGNSIFDETEFKNMLNKDLKIKDDALIDSLTANIPAIKSLAEAMDENTKATKLATQTAINDKYKEKIQETGLDKDKQQFLVEHLGEIAKKDEEELLNKYSSGEYSADIFGSNANLQAAYAEAMGYDPSRTKGGRFKKSATYYDYSGKEVADISDEDVRKQLAYINSINNLGDSIDEQSKKVSSLAILDKKLSKQHGDSIDNYGRYINDLKGEAEKLGFTSKEIDDYVKNYGENKRGTQKVKIKENLESSGIDEETSKFIVEQISSQLSDEQLQVAVEASTDSVSVDDFLRKLEVGISESFLSGIQNSISKVDTILEDNEITADELISLEEDENFKDYLESQGKTMVDITNATYTEQAAIVADYYNNLLQLQGQALENSINNYEADLNEYQAILDYKRAKDENNKTGDETAAAIAKSYAGINFEAYADMDITEVEKKIEEIQSKIDELSDQQIKLAIEWDGIDEIEHSYEKLGDFAKLMQEDSKKAGKSYQLTAAQAREWMEVYPELFNQAKVTEDGIIELNQDTTDTYIKGQESMIDSTIDAKIAELQAEKETLIAKKDAVKQDMEMNLKKAQGTEELEEASATYLRDLRKNLTQYYLDLGYDEVKANAQALSDMGLSQEEYSRLVAQASYDNSENIQKSASEGAAGWAQKFSILWGDLRRFFQQVKDNIINIAKWNFSEVKFGFEWSGFDQPAEITSEITTEDGISVEDYDFSNSSDPYVSKAAMKTAKSNIQKQYEETLDDIDKAILSNENQQLYLQALKNQDAEDYKDTDVDDVTETDKKEKEDKKKKLDEEIDRYHEINEELDDLEKHLNRIEKNTDRAFGQAKLDLYDQQLTDINSEMNLHNQKLREAEAYRLSDQAKLNAFGATYDSSGRISNYDEMVTREINAYNAAVATGDDATIEAAEERYEQFQKYLQNYEESLDTVEEEEEKLSDLVDKAADIKLAKIQYKLEVNIELNEDSLKQLEYQLKKIEHKSFNQAQSIDILQNQAQIHKNNAQYYANSVEEILSSKGLSKAQIKAVQSGDMSAIAGVDFTAEEVKQIRSNVEGIQNENEALLDIDQTIREKIGEAYDEWNEKIDENLEKFNYYDSVMQHYDNILDLLGKKRTNLSAEEAKAIGLAQVANKKNQVEALQAALKEQEKIEAQQRKNIANAKSEEDKKMWEEELNKTLERKKDLQDQILTSTEDLIKKISDIYKRYLQDSLDEFEESISGTFGSLDKLQEAYDRRKTLNDQYIKDYKKIYELNKLNRQLDKALDETSSVKNKDKIKKLQEEINRAQRDGVKLSEYDLEVLQKKYDLKMAEMALDDIKNAKTQVRLVRNQEGTYGYVYTANEEDVDNAIQNYEDKLYELQDLNEQYIEEMGAAFIQTQQEMVDALSKIQLEDFESYADYKKAVDETASYYQERLDYYSKEMQKGLDNNKTLYYEEYNTFKGYNEQKDLSYKQFTTSFHQTTIGQLRKDINSIAEYQQLVNTALYGGGDGSSVTSDSLLGKMYNGYKQWETNINENVLKPLGIQDMNSLKDNIIMRLYGSDPNNVLRILGNGADGVENVWRNSVRNILGMSEEDFNNYKGNLQKLIEEEGGLNDILGGWKANVWGSMYSDDDSIVNGSTKAKKSVTNLANQATNDYKKLSNKTTNWQKQWSKDYQAAINKTDALTNSYLRLVNELSKKHNYPKEEKITRVVTEKVTIYKQQGTPPAASEENPTEDPGNGVEVVPTDTGDKRGNGNIDNGDTVWAINGYAAPAYNYSSAGMPTEKNYWPILTKDRPGTIIKQDGHPLEIDTRRQGTMVFVQLSNGQVELFKKSDLTGYDTGGYTGTWGSYGKIAMLHEKELVLNKQDTANLLDVVSVVRNLVNNLKFPQILTAIESMEPQNISKIDNSKTISQEVNIQADFPGVSNHNEIELALQGLMERASQYAYRD